MADAVKNRYIAAEIERTRQVLYADRDVPVLRGECLGLLERLDAGGGSP